MFVNFTMHRILFFILLSISLIFSEEWVKSIFQNYQSAVVRVINLNNDKVVGEGTGFIISDDGVVVTNYHVVSGAEVVEGDIEKMLTPFIDEMNNLLNPDKFLIKIGFKIIDATLEARKIFNQSQRLCLA